MRQVVTNPTQVAEILRGRRKARRLPQQELAAKLGVSQSRLSALEAGTSALTLDRLLALANLLGLQLILEDKPSKPNKSSSRAEW